MNSSWTHAVFWSVEEIRVFQACAVVNVRTGGMFREPHRMENLPSYRLALSRSCALVVCCCPLLFQSFPSVVNGVRSSV